MNLIITYYCNRKCPYCFAQDKIQLLNETSAEQKGFITLENVSKYLDFLEASCFPAFKILGGEPSIHPRFTDIVEMGIARGFPVEVFTNGLWSDHVVNYFSDKKDKRIKFIVNVNESTLNNRREAKRLRRTLTEVGGQSTLGFNIYQENYDLLFMSDIINRYGLNRVVRLGIACPIVGQRNSYIPSGRLSHVGARLAKQLQILEQKDILGSFDCGFTMCMFKDKELGGLVKSTLRGFESKCGSAIDVGVDLTCWPCFPLSGLLNVKLTDFRNRQEIAEFYHNRLSSLKIFGTVDNCLSCKYRSREQCTGGCLARVILSLMKTDPDVIQKINNARN